MNDFKSKLDDLLDELEDAQMNSQTCFAIWAIRNKIHQLVEDNIPQWHKLIFRNLTPEEEKEYANFDWSYMVENLPDYGEEVLVTDGKNVWIDSFDEDDYVYLSGTDRDLDDVIAWMELPSYKENQDVHELTK